jgi:hypothetical protein
LSEAVRERGALGERAARGGDEAMVWFRWRVMKGEGWKSGGVARGEGDGDGDGLRGLRVWDIEYEYYHT